MEEQTSQNDDGKPYPAEKARQGEIILRHRGQRLVFIGGLVLMAVVILLVRIWMAR
jgi:hypothetical protein